MIYNASCGTVLDGTRQPNLKINKISGKIPAQTCVLDDRSTPSFQKAQPNRNRATGSRNKNKTGYKSQVKVTPSRIPVRVPNYWYTRLQNAQQKRSPPACFCKVNKRKYTPKVTVLYN